MRRPGPHTPDARPPRKRDHTRKREHAREAERRPWPRGGEARHSDAVILYGWHTVKAALDNPARRIRRLYATENAARRLAADGVVPPVAPEVVRPDVIARRLGPDAVHNGLLAEADPLASPELEDVAPAGIVLVLDQITDPHNVGARSCAPRRGSPWPPSSPPRATARRQPACWRRPPPGRWNTCRSSPCRTSRALETLRERGYTLVGLDSTGEIDLAGARRCAARAGAGRGRQRAAAIDPRHLRPGRAARSSGPHQEPQCLQRHGARALYRDQAGELTLAGGVDAVFSLHAPSSACRRGSRCRTTSATAGSAASCPPRSSPSWRRPNTYSGLWYPIVVASMSLIVGFLFLPGTKDVDITVH